MFLSSDQLTARPGSMYDWVTFASDLGLTVGQWPGKFHTDLGNGLPLLRDKSTYNDHRGLVSTVYRQYLGVVTVEIYND